jgi:hypothetical protein
MTTQGRILALEVSVLKGSNKDQLSVRMLSSCRKRTRPMRKVAHGVFRLFKRARKRIKKRVTFSA